MNPKIDHNSLAAMFFDIISHYFAKLVTILGKLVTSSMHLITILRKLVDSLWKFVTILHFETDFQKFGLLWQLRLYNDTRASFFLDFSASSIILQAYSVVRMSMSLLCSISSDRNAFDKVGRQIAKMLRLLGS